MRGTCSLEFVARVPVGLIPAGAGNIVTLSNTPRRVRAHPRGCGEHNENRQVLLCAPGSSPRVRGTSSREAAHKITRGLIPAGAGNIYPRLFRVSLVGAHPRGCGGTSPTPPYHPSTSGLIPAGAGNMDILEEAKGDDGAHPRGCGEHWWGLCVVSRWLGSSPRVRGT